MVSLYVALTDGGWFEHLKNQRDLAEVNFWQPGGATNFRALQPGELFLFKLHSPDNFIVGGGIFAHGTILPISLAWEAFGRANGADSLEEMKKRIERYRQRETQSREDYGIGCRILVAPFFFDRNLWISVPASFSRFVQQGKRYTTDSEDGLNLWDQIEQRTMSAGKRGFAEPQTRYGEPTLITPRLGQGSFRVAVTDAYHRRCAVTQERTLPVLEAAHIKPFSKGGAHEVKNGLLLRSDLHKLFDLGYVTITPEYRLEVSRQIKEEFHNGKYYYQMHGQTVSVPQDLQLSPAASILAWHNSQIFLG